MNDIVKLNAECKEVLSDRNEIKSEKPPYIILSLLFLLVALISGYPCWITRAEGTIQVIDGCQYVRVYNGYRGFNLVHLNSCINKHNKTDYE